MICKNCGKEIDEDSIFCEYCGSEVSNDSDYYENEELSAQKSIMKNKIIILLSIFLVIILFAVFAWAFDYGESKYINNYNSIVHNIVDEIDTGDICIDAISIDNYDNALEISLSDSNIDISEVDLYCDVKITRYLYTYDLDNGVFSKTKRNYVNDYTSTTTTLSYILNNREYIKEDIPLTSVKYSLNEGEISEMNDYQISYKLYAFPKKPKRILERIYYRSLINNARIIEVCKNDYYYQNNNFIKGKSNTPYGGIDSVWENNGLYIANYDIDENEIIIDYDHCLVYR